MYIKIITVFIALLLVSKPVFAWDAKAKSEQESATTRIEIDEKSDVIRFFIKGEPAALLDEQGLHVVGDIVYDGVLSDTGDRDQIKRKIESEIK